ncbi:MAG TPA: ACT domain-containing protein [Acidimicrobiales bacterium]|nr:ACT domain-containing protein [Acidimicrobiales bacterium]
MAILAVTVIGQDRPGIVAAVSRVLVDQGCNLEDTEMAILRGQFAMMLIVAAPDPVTSASLEEAVMEGTAGFDLQVVVRAVPARAMPPGAQDAPQWSVSMHGADKPGIVAAVTEVLAEAGVNITGMETRLIGDPTEPVYAMSLDVELGDDGAGAELATRLGAVADRLGVSCALRRHEPDIL